MKFSISSVLMLEQPMRGDCTAREKNLITRSRQLALDAFKAYAGLSNTLSPTLCEMIEVVQFRLRPFSLVDDPFCIQAEIKIVVITPTSKSKIDIDVTFLQNLDVTSEAALLSKMTNEIRLAINAYLEGKTDELSRLQTAILASAS